MAIDWGRAVSDLLSGGLAGYEFGDKLNQDAKRRKLEEERIAYEKVRDAESDRRYNIAEERARASHATSQASQRQNLIEGGAVESERNPGEVNQETTRAIEGMVGGPYLPKGGGKAPWKTDPSNYTDLGNGMFQSAADTPRAIRERDQAIALQREDAESSSFGEFLAGLKLPPEQQASVQALYDSGETAAATRTAEYYRDFEQDQADRDFNRTYMRSNMQSAADARRARLADDGVTAAASAAAMLSQRGLPVTDGTVRAVLSGPQFKTIFGDQGEGSTNRMLLAIGEWRARTAPAQPAAATGEPDTADPAAMADFARSSHQNIRELENMNLSDAEREMYIEQVREQFRQTFGMDLPEEKSVRRPSPRE